MNTMALEEKQISTKRIYDGKIVNLRVDTVLLPNGREALREVIEHGGAVCVVPVMPDGTVYLVRQYRYPFAEAVLEIPAGKLDAGEQPVDAANRELEEEIGMKASELIYMGEFRPSVAYDMEVIHMYLARGLVKTHQHLDEDEFLNIETYPLDQIHSMILDNQLTDGKTIAAVLKAKALLARESGAQDEPQAFGE